MRPLLEINRPVLKWMRENSSNNAYDDDQPAVPPVTGQIAFTSHRDGSIVWKGGGF